MTDTARRYGTSHPQSPISGCVRPNERVDEKAARMLGCSPDHCKKLRLGIIADSITAILAACESDPSKAEAFRRQCLTALSAEPTPSLTPDLILDAARKDAEEDVAAATATVEGLSEPRRRSWIRQLRDELGVKANLLRALEAQS